MPVGCSVTIAEISHKNVQDIVEDNTEVEAFDHNWNC